MVGDILCVETGDKLPADGRLLESHELMADESALTGESMPVHKEAGIVFDSPQTPVAERRNLLYSGCFITGGNGKIAVTGVGDHTEFGKIARELASVDSGSTPLQEKMARWENGSRFSAPRGGGGISVQLIIFLVERHGFPGHGVRGVYYQHRADCGGGAGGAAHHRGGVPGHQYY